jgi:fatty acyl-CoA reductase
LKLFAGIPARKLKHVEAIAGDVDREDLGLSKTDIARLSESCTHVFHVAAFISFAAQLDQAIRINLRGTRAVLALACSMQKLKAMVHVSTAYANCTLDKEYASFDEIIYPVDVDPLQILDAVRVTNSFMISAESDPLLELISCPNRD